MLEKIGSVLIFIVVFPLMLLPAWWGLVTLVFSVSLGWELLINIGPFDTLMLAWHYPTFAMDSFLQATKEK